MTVRQRIEGKAHRSLKIGLPVAATGLLVDAVFSELSQPDEAMLEAGRRELARLLPQLNAAGQREVARLVWDAMLRASSASKL